MTEQSIIERLEIISQYDQSLDKLIEDKAYFVNQCKIALEKESAPVKIYPLAFNFAWTLRYVIGCAQKYLDAIKNSLLDDRYQKNLENKEKIETEFRNLIPLIDDFEKTAGLSPIDVEQLEKSHYEQLKEKEDIADDHVNYLVELCKDLALNGHQIALLISIYLNRLNRLITDITLVRVGRSEYDKRFLFEREYKDFTLTDEWEETSNAFIESIIKVRFRGVEPKETNLLSLRDDEYNQMMTLKNELGQFEAFLGDNSKLAKTIIEKEIACTKNNAILQLFGHLGIIDLIDEWIDDIRNEGQLVSYDDEDTSPLSYTEKLSEKRMKRLWPKIEALYDNRPAIDWVCLFHVLVFRNYVTCDSFKEYVIWLNKMAGRDVITPVNARQIKMSYWAKDAKREWTLEKLHKWKNSTRIDSRFKEFDELCTQINNVFK